MTMYQLNCVCNIQNEYAYVLILKNISHLSIFLPPAFSANVVYQTSEFRIAARIDFRVTGFLHERLNRKTTWKKQKWKELFINDVTNWYYWLVHNFCIIFIIASLLKIQIESNNIDKRLFISHKDFLSFVLESISPTCLCTAFTCADPKSSKRQSSHQCLFTLLGSVHTKASGKTLVKLTSGVNFINVLCTPFSSKFF